MKIVSFTGWSNTGKTGFIESLLRLCSGKGIAAAAIKKSRHAADLPPEAKDSVRFFGAGAHPSIYLTDDDMTCVTLPPARLDSTGVAALCGDARYIFCEGLAVEGAVRVLACGSARSEEELKRPLDSADAVITSEASLAGLAEGKGIRCFSPSEAEAFLEYLDSLEDKMGGNATGDNGTGIRIYCDGKELPLVPYVARLFAETLSAMVGTLKGADGASDITISMSGPRAKK